jgi:prepilin-type N-terminal cleavage/methylation domain-containing protein
VRSPRALYGFTLIELLVVITIVVVLLALLTPALDKAIYQAELAACAARLDNIALGATAYAAENQGRYPHRALAIGALRPMMINFGSPTTPGGRLDDRPRLIRHVGLDTLVDPMVAKLDLSAEANGPSTAIYASYCLWFGWQIADGHGSKGLKRIGDRLGYDNGVDKYAFNILASDADSVQTGWGFSQASHPDPGGPYLGTLQNEPGASPTQGSFTYSFWTHANSRNKGPIDRQFAYTDGSVRRLDGLIIKDNGEPDDQVIAIPGVANAASDLRLKEHLPPR